MRETKTPAFSRVALWFSRARFRIFPRAIARHSANFPFLREKCAQCIKPPFERQVSCSSAACGDEARATAVPEPASDARSFRSANSSASRTAAEARLLSRSIFSYAGGRALPISHQFKVVCVGR